MSRIDHRKVEGCGLATAIGGSESPLGLRLVGRAGPRGISHARNFGGGKTEQILFLASDR